MKDERSAPAESAWDPWDCWSCPTRKAVQQFSETRFMALARKVIFGLQRTRASGIHGEDYRHRTLWDEYCHEVHTGPTPGIESAWGPTINPYLAYAVESLRQEEAVILTIGAAWLLNKSDDLQELYEGDFPVDARLVQECVEVALHKIADARNMLRFDPNL